MTIFHYDVDGDGIATITWDLPEKSMNVLNEQGIRELDAHVDTALADENVKGIIITSAKPDFAGGMDLNVLANMRKVAETEGQEAIYQLVMGIHRVLRKIERAGADPKTNKGGKPVVWAGRGTAAGIGTEIALATHHRIFADGPKSKIGLPEIKVGLFPGAGGTTRVVRMVGLMAAAPILLEGRLFDPAKAKAAGLVDEVVSDNELIDAARNWILNAKPEDIVKPWDEKGYKMPGGAPYTPAGMQNFVGANAMVAGNTQNVYPAAHALLSAIYEGALVPFDGALEIEARYFTKILQDPVSQAMIQTLFIDKQAIEKGANRPDVADQTVKKMGVLGAGMMGAGIAQIAARAGIEVVLLDRDVESAERGKSKIAEGLATDVKRKKMTQEAHDDLLGRIKTTADYADLEGADLVIEAVFEDPSIKAEATQRCEAVIPESAIFASNTSTLPISDLANASCRPEQYIGMHFFSPVPKMPLLEIIKGEKTGDMAVAKALDFARQVRKTPIVVNDARFFYANRLIIPYLNEGIRMISEGVPPAMIENAAKQLGFPVGPLQLNDEISLDLGVKIAKATKDALGDAYDDGADAVLYKLFDMGRLGRKANAGFYEYDDKGKRIGLWSGLAEHFPPSAELPDFSIVKDRLMLIQVLEGLRALEEGVLMDVREGDVGAIMGWGFAPWSGGPFHYIDMMGADKILARTEELTEKFGKRFTPTDNLRDKAAKNERFTAA